MLFITQWQVERVAGTLTAPLLTDENAPAEPADHRDEDVRASA